jgi:hypothetical protein
MHHALIAVRKRGRAGDTPGEHKQVFAVTFALYIVFIPIGGLGEDDD